MLGVLVMDWFLFVLMHFCFGFFGRICCKLEWLLGAGISMKEVKFLECLLEEHFWSCLLLLEVCEVIMLTFRILIIIHIFCFCNPCWNFSCVLMHLFTYNSSAITLIECNCYFASIITKGSGMGLWWISLLHPSCQLLIASPHLYLPSLLVFAEVWPATRNLSIPYKFICWQ